MSIGYRGPLGGRGYPGCIEVWAAGPASAGRARNEFVGKFRNVDVAAAMSAHSREMVSEAYAAEGMVAKQTLQETVKLRLAAVSALLAHAQGPPYSQRQFCLINPLAR